MATRNSQSDGEWLCPAGLYQDLVKSLTNNDPRLKKRDTKAVAQGTLWPPRKLRIVSMELEAGKFFKQTAEWSDAAKFRQHLESNAASTTSQKNIILVEGLSPDLIDILGTRFDIHPSFFVDHERVVVFAATPTRTSDIPSLPSCFDWNGTTKGLTLKYFEPMELNPCPWSFRLSCVDSGRHVGVFRLRGHISPVIVVRRKCSIWPILHPGGGYTCIVLCDPPLTGIKMKGGSGSNPTKVIPVRTFPYQGGYLDFMVSQAAQKNVGKGPPRSSMLDDLRYYLTEHGPNLPDLGSAKCPSVFVEKIVASHYLSLSSFMSSVLSTQQWDLSRQEDMAKFSLSMVEQQWSDIQSWERRLNEYCNDFEELMVKLGVPFQDPDASSIQGPALFNPHVDFQFLWMRLKGLRHRAEQINTATAGLASIAGNRQANQGQQLSLQETQKTKALTLLGLIFIPLAYTATLFSMNERYLPGEALFWVYFLVSVPLICCVILAYFILSKVYGSGWLTVRINSRIRGNMNAESTVTSKKPLFNTV